MKFLVCRDIEHPHELFARLRNVRSSVKYISENMLTSDAGVLDGKDIDFKLNAAVVDKFILRAGTATKPSKENPPHLALGRVRGPPEASPCDCVLL